jgi:hypothetical protein
VQHHQGRTATRAFGVVLAAVSRVVSRRPARPFEMLALGAANACLAALLSRVFGPLLLVPAVTCVMAVSLTSYPSPS